MCGECKQERVVKTNTFYVLDWGKLDMHSKIELQRKLTLRSVGGKTFFLFFHWNDWFLMLTLKIFSRKNDWCGMIARSVKKNFPEEWLLRMIARTAWIAFFEAKWLIILEGHDCSLSEGLWGGTLGCSKIGGRPPVGSSHRSDDLEKIKNPLRPLGGGSMSNVGNTIRSSQNLLGDEI